MKKIELIFETVVSIIMNLLTLGFIWYVVRGVHVEMVKENCRVLKRATFSEIAHLIKTTNWLPNSYHPDSLFDKDYKNQFHASIIEFNGVGYILTSYGIIRATAMKNRFAKRVNRNRTNHVWLN